GLGVAVASDVAPGSTAEVVTFTNGVIYWSPATGSRVLADATTIHALGQHTDSDPSFSLTGSWANPAGILQAAANQPVGISLSATGTLSLNLAQRTAYANLDFAGFQFDTDKLQDLLNGGGLALPSIDPLDFLTSLFNGSAGNDYDVVRTKIY